MASPSPSWVILDTAPRVATAAGELQPGADISLALAAPPRVTQLTVAPTVLAADPDPHADIDSPCVLAADPTGLFLVLAPPSVSERPPTEARAYRGPDGVERTIHVGRVPKPACFVLDVPSGAASRVPDPDFLNASTVGFQNIVGCDEATLICFSSEAGEWVEVDVDNPLPNWIWSFDGVVSHDGKLWWLIEWTPEHCVSFAEIWDSYKAAGLPMPKKKPPRVAFIHPENPDIVYFFVKKYLFAVNRRTKKVVESEAHEGRASSSSGVLAWELPPALTAGI
uniref:DUF1618 domain-containing protein n=1 Tax=Setaria viridis TaxID=4556 RepID=A0A4V6D265_SETVI|nr:hypothetical protein SEVIR_9G492500v2 [Setaria viridis]